jgi:hypothetical protein
MNIPFETYFFRPGRRRDETLLPRRLALAFGTAEAAVASILLNSLINAAWGGTPGHPPSEQDINGVLAAVHGIRANDEIEAMLAVQMVATHCARHARCAV